MNYAPTVEARRASKEAGTPFAVAVSEPVANQRHDGRDKPDWIGTIHSGIGTPLKVLHADMPVDRVVAKAFTDGSPVRGLGSAPGSDAPYTLAVTIHAFHANQYIQREATVDLAIALRERATGPAVWSDRHRTLRVDGSRITLNAFGFASVEDFRVTASAAMSEAVDVLLDKPGFRAALRRV